MSLTDVEQLLTINFIEEYEIKTINLSGHLTPPLSIPSKEVIKFELTQKHQLLIDLLLGQSAPLRSKCTLCKAY